MLMTNPQPSESFKAHQDGARSDTAASFPIQADPSPRDTATNPGAAGCDKSLSADPVDPARVSVEASAAAPSRQDTEPAAEQTVPFTCHVCGLSEQCHYRGARPPFSRSVQLAEAGYVMRDPFSARGAGQLLLLGSDCALCRRPVCQDTACSLFFTRRFCLPCATQRAAEFPPQLRDKLAA